MSAEEQLKNDELIARAILEEEEHSKTVEWFNRNPDVVAAALKQEAARQKVESKKFERNFDRLHMEQARRSLEPYSVEGFAGGDFMHAFDTSLPSFQDFFYTDSHPSAGLPSNTRAQHIRVKEGDPLHRAFVHDFKEEEKKSVPKPNFNSRNPKSPRPPKKINGNRNEAARTNNSHNSRRGDINPQNGPPQIGIEDYMLHDSESHLEYEDLLRLDDHNFDKGNGLSSAQLSKLRLKPFSSKHKCQNCLICLTDFRQSEQVCDVGCEHLFHEKCIKDWLSRKTVCPVCKFEVKTTLNKLTRR